MTSRFASNLLVLLAGAFLTTASLAMGADVVGWLGLAVGCLVALGTLTAFAARGRGVLQRVLDGIVVTVAAWNVVASRVFVGQSSLRWLMFSAGAALVVLAAEGLVAHEVVMEISLRRAARLERSAVTVVEEPAPIRVAG